MSLSKNAIKKYHQWATTNFDNAHIIKDDAHHCHPSGLQKINPSRIPALLNVRAPLALGNTGINFLLMNLQNSVIDPSSITFEVAVVSWYSNLLLHGHSAADTTGTKNIIFQLQAFGITSSTHST